MAVLRIPLKRQQPKPEVGFEIQGLQYSSDVFHNNSIKDIVIQTINPQQERGRHFHERKTEWFIALEGEAELQWSETTNPKIEEPMLLKADFENPYVLEVQPRTCHLVVNKSDKIFKMASFSTEEFDKNNPDNPKCKVEG